MAPPGYWTLHRRQQQHTIIAIPHFGVMIIIERPVTIDV